jgi:hypothetical protein
VLNGFSPTATILASISLVEFPTGTTFYLSSYSNLTAASGFGMVGNKTRLVFTGTMASINTALESLKVNTGSAIGNVKLSVAATINPTGYYYNGTNGHFYKPVTTGTYYKTARANALATTFKGQTGYLVTITSASEDAFIQANVPATQIWFACTDEVTDGVWVIDAGPEKGAVIKTSNANSGNVPGQYNNWAGGEPNGYNHGEDYAVTKWNGNLWNDLYNQWNNPYVIEYGTWSNPDDQTFTDFYTNSTTHTNGEVLTARFNIDFGGNVDETKFSVKANTYVNNIWGVTTNTSRPISGLGKVDITNDLDATKINNGYKATITPGDVEWSLINPYETNLNGHRLQIDEREFYGTGINLNQITSIKLFDLYEGPIQALDFNGWWKQWVIPANIDLTNKVAASSFQSSLRLQDGWYGIRAEYTFTPNTSFKQHGIELVPNSQAELNTLYNSIVTVSDVYLAFKELSSGGLFGNETGNEFTSGIQYMNADVDENGIFNEADTYKLLQHLTGAQPLTQYTALTYLMKLYDKSDYDVITKSNWNTKSNVTRSLIPFNLNSGTLNNTYNINVTWKGDVNLSHSAQQSISNLTTNSFRTMSINSKTVSNGINASVIGEINSGKVIVTISLDPLQQEVVGTQFQLNYDNSLLKFEKVDFTTKGNPLNYGRNSGNSIMLGSLISDGSTILDKTTEYKITFGNITEVTDILGSFSIVGTDAVNKSGTQLKVTLN